MKKKSEKTLKIDKNLDYLEKFGAEFDKENGEFLQLCDLCGDYFDIQQIRYTGKQFLCDKCLK